MDQFEAGIVFTPKTAAGNLVTITAGVSLVSKVEAALKKLAKAAKEKQEEVDRLKQVLVGGALSKAEEVLEAWPTLETQKPTTARFDIDKSAHHVIEGKLDELNKRLNYGKNDVAVYDPVTKALVGDTFMTVPPKFDPSTIISIDGPSHKVQAGVKTFHLFLTHFKLSGNVRKVTRVETSSAKSDKPSKPSVKKAAPKVCQHNPHHTSPPLLLSLFRALFYFFLSPSLFAQKSKHDPKTAAQETPSTNAAHSPKGVEPATAAAASAAGGRGAGVEQAAPAGRGAGVSAGVPSPAPASAADAGGAGRGGGVAAAPEALGRGCGVAAAPATPAAATPAAGGGRGGGVPEAAAPAGGGRGTAVDAAPPAPAPAAVPAAAAADPVAAPEPSAAAEGGGGGGRGTAVEEAAPTAAAGRGGGRGGVDLSKPNAGRGAGRGAVPAAAAAPDSHVVQEQRERTRRH